MATIVIGKPIIHILAQTGAWESESGDVGLIAADELFHNDPYEVVEQLEREIEVWKKLVTRLRAELELKSK